MLPLGSLNNETTKVSRKYNELFVEDHKERAADNDGFSGSLSGDQKAMLEAIVCWLVCLYPTSSV